MPQTFRDHIAANQRKSWLLVAVFVLLVAVAAVVMALALLAWIHPELTLSVHLAESAGVGLHAAAVSFGISLISYYSGDHLILGVHGAREMAKSDDPQLFNVVEEMAIAAGVPMPKVYLIQDPAMNAFATGRDPKHASVAITTGLRERLNREELQGVIAHEMSHIRHYDIRLMLLLAVLIGTLTMLADFFWQFVRFGDRPRSSGSDDSKSSFNALTIVVFALALLFSVLAPLLARMLQFAVSRQREFLADAGGVELTRNPNGLASALKKLSTEPHRLKLANRGTAHLFIVNPIEKFEALAAGPFASHPPTPTRIARLLSLITSE